MATKRSRKWSAVEQQAKRLADLGTPPGEIAQILGVNKGSVSRWMKSGKLRNTARGRLAPDTEKKMKEGVVVQPVNLLDGRRPNIHPVAPVSPEDWAKTIRSQFDLDATDDQLVTIAEAQLAMTADPFLGVKERLSAAAAFKDTVKQLAITVRMHVERGGIGGDGKPKEPPKRTNPVVQRTSTGDPRALLRVVGGTSGGGGVAAPIAEPAKPEPEPEQ